MSDGLVTLIAVAVVYVASIPWRVFFRPRQRVTRETSSD